MVAARGVGEQGSEALVCEWYQGLMSGDAGVALDYCVVLATSTQSQRVCW